MGEIENNVCLTDFVFDNVEYVLKRSANLKTSQREISDQIYANLSQPSVKIDRKTVSLKL